MLIDQFEVCGRMHAYAELVVPQPHLDQDADVCACKAQASGWRSFKQCATMAQVCLHCFTVGTRI